MFGIDSGIIAICLDDLDLYADYLNSPLTFLHYLKQRQAATKLNQLYLYDELDHLGGEQAKEIGIKVMSR